MAISRTNADQSANVIKIDDVKPMEVSPTVNAPVTASSNLTPASLLADLDLSLYQSLIDEQAALEETLQRSRNEKKPEPLAVAPVVVSKAEPTRHAAIAPQISKKPAPVAAAKPDPMSSREQLIEKFLACAGRGEIQEMQAMMQQHHFLADERGLFYKTPLMAAAAKGNMETIRFLLHRARADINLEDINERRAIDYAAENGHEAVVASLLQSGSRANKLPVIKMSAKKSAVEAAKVTLFKPAAIASSAALIPLASAVAPGSIINDAKKIVDLLKQKSQRVLGESDIGAPSWGDSDAHDKKYALVHNAIITLQESGLPEARFHAACELIELSLQKKLPAEMKEGSYGVEELEIVCQHGGEQFVINAKHNNRILSRSGYKYENFAAPICKIPYDGIKLSLDQLNGSLFSGWNNDPVNSNMIKRRYSNQNDYYQSFSIYTSIEKACKEIDSSFSFNMNPSDNDQSFSINKNSLERARLLLSEGPEPQIKLRV